MAATGISVIIPTHNRRELLAGAVESVRAQTFRDWDLLIVDDGSDDGTDRDWSDPGDPRIRYLRTERKGVSAARNLGIQQAKSPWIGFLDSDDTWLPKKLEIQLSALESHPGYLAVHSDEIWIRRGRRVNPKKIHRKYGGWVYRYSLPRCVISPSSILIARELLDRCGNVRRGLPRLRGLRTLAPHVRPPSHLLRGPAPAGQDRRPRRPALQEHLGTGPVPGPGHGENSRKRGSQHPAGGLDGGRDRPQVGDPGGGVRETGVEWKKPDTIDVWPNTGAGDTRSE